MLMDISQAAFGLDMRTASRLYFISPVLNPQVEAQAIGRVRRISQKKLVSVETLVLRGSLEEVIMERRKKMTQADHRKCKSILDDQPIHEWIRNATILPLPEGEVAYSDQMVPLRTRHLLFGRGFGRIEHPDEGLVTDHQGASTASSASNGTSGGQPQGRSWRGQIEAGTKREHASGPGEGPWRAHLFARGRSSSKRLRPDEEVPAPPIMDAQGLL